MSAISKPDADTCYWVTSGQVAELAGTTIQAAQKALQRATKGHPWNDVALKVRKQGRSYLVDARSLPEHLYRKFYDANREALAPAPVASAATTLQPKQSSVNKERLAKEYRRAEWLAGIIAQALEFRSGTHGRGEVLRSLARQTHIRPSDGKPIRFAEDKLREYCQKFAQGGVHALMRRERKIEETARHLVSRRWESACPLPQPEKARLAQDIEAHIRGLWVAGAPSRDKVRELASAKLAQLCRAAGWTEATAKNCDVGQYLVESNQDARRVAVYHRDAKRYADTFRPRIQRSRAEFRPGECIVGDVHPVDVYLLRADGSTYTPRMIAWYDLATNRCFYTLVHCEPGRSVTQADVTRSFFELCMAWGIPRRLYLDNGSEYSWEPMVDGFKALAALGAELDVRLGEIAALEAQWAVEAAGADEAAEPADGPPMPDSGRVVVRAKPYNAAAKPIEGAFSAKEKVFSMLPGYIGGDRMSKRVSKVGRLPDAYPGTAEGFDRDFAEAMDFFHALPQRGHLKGLSPDEAFAAKQHLVTKTIAPPAVFLLMFSEERSLKVRTQGVQLGSKDGGKWYYNDALIPLIGTTQRFRIAKWRPEAIVLVQGNGAAESYTAINETRVYDFFDVEGAKEASRREGIAKRHVRQLKDAAPEVDLQAEMRTYAAERRRSLPEPLAPAQERRIGTSAALRTLGEQLSAENKNPVKRLAPGEFLDGEGVVQRLPTRKESLVDKPSTASLPGYKVQRPGPRQHDPFDMQELGRRAIAERREEKRSDEDLLRPTGTI
ncbi:MAG: hypothetical protein JNJ44_02130 [Zoogloeaceae bacterium]|nr:hypothetical protein [Zoogloeaceae bacterium]